VQIFAILFLLYQQPFFGLPSFEIGVFLLFSATFLTLYSGKVFTLPMNETLMVER
jgi:CDP-diacylglycerol--glycerol-3-phosphate 3-phosphatidyltransferase